MIYLRTMIILFVSLIMISLTGCFSSNPNDIEAFSMPDEVDTTTDKYILQPPDVIRIYCTNVPEIHGQEQQIRPDGKISFENLGEVIAAGKTPEQLSIILRERVLELYKSQLVTEKSIDLRIAAFQSKSYYVLGQVYRPGPKLYTGRDTVLTAIAQAQPNPMAWIERIQVIRPSNDKNIKPFIFEVNFDRMSAHGDASKNILLQEGDIIYVPPTVLSVVALKLEEVIRPIARAFSAIYIVETEGQGYYRGY